MFSSIFFKSLSHFSLSLVLLATVLSSQVLAQDSFKPSSYWPSAPSDFLSSDTTALRDQEAELNIQIASTPPKSFEEIRNIFSQNILYRLDCVKDTSERSQNTPESYLLFQSMVLPQPNFALAFQVRENESTIDVGVRQQLQSDLRYHPAMKPYSDTRLDGAHEVDCVKSADGDDNYCVRLDAVRDVAVLIDDEKYDTIGDYSQEMIIYPASADEIFARLRINLTAYTLDEFKRRSGSVSYQEAFVCRIEPMSAKQIASSAAMALLPERSSRPPRR